jgi:hypothetical protein
MMRCEPDSNLPVELKDPVAQVQKMPTQQVIASTIGPIKPKDDFKTVIGSYRSAAVPTVTGKRARQNMDITTTVTEDNDTIIGVVEPAPAPPLIGSQPTFTTAGEPSAQ